MTKEERKAIAKERKERGKIVTLQRKAIRSNYARNGGRF